eukprot:327054-Chlamydomonas_euryale.AAC.2
MSFRHSGVGGPPCDACAMLAPPPASADRTPPRRRRVGDGDPAAAAPPPPPAPAYIGCHGGNVSEERVREGVLGLTGVATPEQGSSAGRISGPAVRTGESEGVMWLGMGAVSPGVGGAAWPGVGVVWSDVGVVWPGVGVV